MNLRPILRLLTPGDKILIAVLVLVSLGSLGFLVSQKEPGQTATISVDRELELQKQLRHDEVFTIQAAQSLATIEIRGGSIRVSESGCPRRLCINQGAIRNIGEVIVCVPNKMVIQIAGKRTNKFDAITG